MTFPTIARFLAGALAVTALWAPAISHAATEAAVVTVMQFKAKSTATQTELKKRMLAIRDFQRNRPGYVENNLYENSDDKGTPQFIGVARWNSLKDWEGLWLSPQFQKLIAEVNEVGTLQPGVFRVVK